MRLFLASLLIFNAACSVTPPNAEVCVRLKNGAACTYTLEGPDRNLTEEDFMTEQVGIIFMTPEEWVKIRNFIEEVCARRNMCNDNWERVEGFVTFHQGDKLEK